jgi:poly(hydroxyalkanoate) depolymerase family esterase
VVTIAQNIARLAAARAGGSAYGAVDRLTDLSSFGANPGALRARVYLPPALRPGAPLVVALHGCTQTAAGYDHGTGWSALADRHGFALLLPEQIRTNNPNLCFNWFLPGDIGRTGGEAESIARMVEALLGRHGLDRNRVFVTGLSAGGAMTAVMLATYPDLFAGGAIIGGLPYGCASDVTSALAQMRAQGGGDDDALAAAVRSAAKGHKGLWPTLSLWHGTADRTVDIANMDRLGRQWRRVHGVAQAASQTIAHSDCQHRTWRDARGRAVIEEWRMAGMGHGVPLSPSGADGLGAAGPYMLDVGVSSTAHIARFWGLAVGDEIGVASPAQPIRATRPTRLPTRLAADLPPPPEENSIQHTIERALRSAGLMR